MFPAPVPNPVLFAPPNIAALGLKVAFIFGCDVVGCWLLDMNLFCAPNTACCCCVGWLKMDGGCCGWVVLENNDDVGLVYYFFYYVFFTVCY